MTSCKEISEIFERTLKLETPPVAVKFVKTDEDPPKGLSKNFKPISFCQATTIARQGGYALYQTRERNSCMGARTAFGFGDHRQVERYIQTIASEMVGRYVPTEEAAIKALKARPVIEPGLIKGVAIAPLSKARFEPDCVLFVCLPWQSYYLANAYLWETGGVFLNYEVGFQSMVCSYSAVKAGWRDEVNCGSTCSGARFYAGVETTQLYFSLPGKKLDLLIKGVEARAKRIPYPGLIMIPIPAPYSVKHFFEVKKTNQ